MRIGEYVALIAAADMTGDYGVGVLLESCLRIVKTSAACQSSALE